MAYILLHAIFAGKMRQNHSLTSMMRYSTKRIMAGKARNTRANGKIYARNVRKARLSTIPKAILELEMPESCWDCPLVQGRELSPMKLVEGKDEQTNH